MKRAPDRPPHARPARGEARPEVEAPPALGSVLDFMRLMWEVDHGLQRASRRMEAVFGVTGPQRLVIRIVGRFPGIPAGHLARLLHIHPSTLTGIVARLERQGLLRRRSDPRDGRRWLLGLTDKGRQVDVAREGTAEAAISSALDGIANDKIAAAREVLSAIARALAEHEVRTGVDTRPGLA